MINEPPNSVEAEKGLLGCILLDSNSLNECAQKLKADDFYDHRNKAIYEACLEMWREKEPIDTITLHQKLKDKKLIKLVGEVAYFAELQNSTPSPANIGYYSEIVIEKGMLRELLNTSRTLSERVSAHDGDIGSLFNEAERAILGIRLAREGGRGEASLSSVQNELIGDYEAAMNNQTAMGLQSGFIDLDNVMGGMMPQESIIIAGTPSAGKTTLALNILFNLASLGHKVGFISLETSCKKIVHRFHCMAGQVEGSGFLRGQVNQGMVDKMTIGTSIIAKLKDNIFLRDDIYDSTALIAACRQMYQKGVRIFAIDYLQLLKAGSGTEYEQVTQASKCCKQIAKELNCPVLVISSLNRGDKDAKKKPTMSDLRGSGNIEFDADKILLLHCEDRESKVRTVEVNVCKNKDFEVGRKELTLFAAQFRFANAAKVDAADMPRNPYSD